MKKDVRSCVFFSIDAIQRERSQWPHQFVDVDVGKQCPQACILHAGKIARIASCVWFGLDDFVLANIHFNTVWRRIFWRSPHVAKPRVRKNLMTSNRSRWTCRRLANPKSGQRVWRGGVRNWPITNFPGAHSRRQWALALHNCVIVCRLR